MSSERTCEEPRFGVLPAEADADIRLTPPGEIDLAARHDLAYAADRAVSLPNPQRVLRRVLHLTGIHKHIRIMGGGHEHERTDDGSR